MSMTHVPEIRYDKAWYTLATKSTVDFVADLSPVCRKSTVAGSVDRVAVDIVANVAHVQLRRLCRKWVIFVARMSNVLSTLSPVSRSTLSPMLNMFNSVDFVESGLFLSPECRTSFRLCRQCVRAKATRSSLSTLSPCVPGLNRHQNRALFYSVPDKFGTKEHVKRASRLSGTGFLVSVFGADFWYVSAVCH